MDNSYCCKKEGCFEFAKQEEKKCMSDLLSDLCPKAMIKRLKRSKYGNRDGIRRKVVQTDLSRIWEILPRDGGKVAS